VSPAAAAPVDGSADERTAMLEALYRALNQHDIDTLVEHLAPGVDWPDESTGRRLHGRDAVRAYWQKQWQEIDPTAEPMRINIAPDGTAHVLVDQLVRARGGDILQNRRVEHVFEFDGAFISRMTVIGLAQGEVDRKDDDEDGEDGGEGEGGDSGG
jgi:limonene-1,2-epoxide hydrolase